MEGNARIWFTPKQKAELWERRKSGQCVADIARALERRNKSGVYRVLALNGGIAPTQRRRASVALRLEEREQPTDPPALAARPNSRTVINLKTAKGAWPFDHLLGGHLRDRPHPESPS